MASVYLYRIESRCLGPACRGAEGLHQFFNFIDGERPGRCAPRMRDGRWSQGWLGRVQHDHCAAAVLKLHANPGAGGMDAVGEMPESGDELIIVDSGESPVSQREIVCIRMHVNGFCYDQGGTPSCSGGVVFDKLIADRAVGVSHNGGHGGHDDTVL